MILITAIFISIIGATNFPNTPALFNSRYNRNPILSFSFQQYDCANGAVYSDQNNYLMVTDGLCPSRTYEGTNYLNAVVGITVQSTYSNSFVASYSGGAYQTTNGYHAIEMFFTLNEPANSNYNQMLFSSIDLTTQPNSFNVQWSTIEFVYDPTNSGLDYIQVYFMYEVDTYINFSWGTCGFDETVRLSNPSIVGKLIYLSYIADKSVSNNVLNIGIVGSGKLFECSLPRSRCDPRYCTPPFIDLITSQNFVFSLMNVYTPVTGAFAYYSPENPNPPTSLSGDVHLFAIYNSGYSAFDAYVHGLQNSVPATAPISYVTTYRDSPYIYLTLLQYDYDSSIKGIAFFGQLNSGYSFYCDGVLIVPSPSNPFLCSYSNSDSFTVGYYVDLGIDLTAGSPLACPGAPLGFTYKLTDEICSRQFESYTSPQCLSVNLATGYVCIVDQNINPISVNTSVEVLLGLPAIFNVSVTDRNDYLVGRTDGLLSQYGVHLSPTIYFGGSQIVFYYTGSTFLTNGYGGPLLHNGVSYYLNEIEGLCYNTAGMSKGVDTSILYYHKDNGGLWSLTPGVLTVDIVTVTRVPTTLRPTTFKPTTFNPTSTSPTLHIATLVTLGPTALRSSSSPSNPTALVYTSSPNLAPALIPALMPPPTSGCIKLTSSIWLVLLCCLLNF